jgi:hypothetical protein
MHTRTRERHQQPVDPHSLPPLDGIPYSIVVAEVLIEGITSSSPAAVSATCTSKRSRYNEEGLPARSRPCRLNGSDVEIPFIDHTGSATVLPGQRGGVQA